MGNPFTGHGMYAAVSFDNGKTWPVRKTADAGGRRLERWSLETGFHRHTDASRTCRVSRGNTIPRRSVPLISSRLHYRFNLPWLVESLSIDDAKPLGKGQEFEPRHH